MDDIKLVKWERWGLVGVILGLGVVRVLDARPFDTAKLDHLEYYNLVLEFALHVAAIWAVLNARKLFEWLFNLWTDVLIERGVAIAVPLPPDSPAPVSSFEEESPTDKAEREDLERALQEKRVAAEKKRELLFQKMNTLAAGCVAPVAALIIAISVIVLVFHVWPKVEPRSEDNAEVGDEQRVNDGPPQPSQSCIPDYCQRSGDAYQCDLPGDSNPSRLAQRLLGETASLAEVGRLADQIMTENREALAGRTDRQIPARTPLRVRMPERACP